MKYKLSDLFELQMGKTPSRDNPEYWYQPEFPWISIADLSNAGKYIYDTKESLSRLAVEESGIKIIPAQAVIMSFKLSIGKVSITPVSMYSNEAIMAFIDKGIVKIKPEYLYYLLLQRDWDEEANKAVMGKTLNKATLSDVIIDIHPIEEQERIVDVLDKASEIIDSYQRQLRTLDTLIKARFVEMFSSRDDAHYCPLKECCTSVTGGSTPSMKQKEYYGGDVPFIKSGDVKADYVSSGALWLTKKALEETTARFVPTGTVVVVTRSGILKRDLPVAITTVPVVINQDLKAFELKPEFSPQYIAWAIRSQSDVVLSKTRVMTVDNIESKELFGLPIMVASIAEQRRFEAFALQVDKSKVVEYAA